MRLLVQLSTNNRNNADNPPEEEIINKLPAIETRVLETYNTEVQSAKSDSDSIKLKLEKDIKKEIDSGFVQQEEGGYKSDSTTWSDYPDNWYPTDTHHYFFYITFESIGIFNRSLEEKLHFIHQSTEEDNK
jgi:hypothetical protein